MLHNELCLLSRVFDSVATLFTGIVSKFLLEVRYGRYVSLLQLLRNEISLALNPKRKINYDNIMSLGHMENVDGFVDHQDCYILPYYG